MGPRGPLRCANTGLRGGPPLAGVARRRGRGIGRKPRDPRRRRP